MLVKKTENNKPVFAVDGVIVNLAGAGLKPSRLRVTDSELKP